MAYNSRRGILGAMSVAGKTAYQLFDIEYTFGQKGNYSVRPLRKSKWHWQYSDEEGIYFFLLLLPINNHYIDNSITSIDFSPSGETTATIDKYGICLISDVNTSSYKFHLVMGMKSNPAFRKIFF